VRYHGKSASKTVLKAPAANGAGLP